MREECWNLQLLHICSVRQQLTYLEDNEVFQCMISSQVVGTMKGICYQYIRSINLVAKLVLLAQVSWSKGNILDGLEDWVFSQRYVGAHVSPVVTHHSCQCYVGAHVSPVVTHHSCQRYVGAHVSPVGAHHSCQRYVGAHVSPVVTHHSCQRYVEAHVSPVVTHHSCQRYVGAHVSPVVTHHSCPDDWLAQFSLTNIHKGDI